MTLSMTQGAVRDRVVQSLGQLPPFSPILNKLIASLAHEDVSLAELAGWIEKDTVITGNVLRLVNSATYGRRGTVSNVRHAIAIMGVFKLRNIALGMSVCRMWSQTQMPRGWSSARFNLHASATGILADMVAQEKPVVYGEGAFVAGLMHDIGKLVTALAVPAEYETLIEMTADPAHDPIECEREIFGMTHPETSQLVLEKWNLPLPIREAVRHHHDAPLTHSGDAAMPLAVLLRAADCTVNALGIQLAAGNPENGADPAEPLAGVGLAEYAPKLLDNFRHEFEELRNFF